jgi:hypothetical protein
VGIAKRFRRRIATKTGRLHTLPSTLPTACQKYMYMSYEFVSRQSQPTAGMQRSFEKFITTLDRLDILESKRQDE